MLLDIGNVDEAIRQLNVVVQRDPQGARTTCSLRPSDEGPLPDSIESARKAIVSTQHRRGPLLAGGSLRMRSDEITRAAVSGGITAESGASRAPGPIV
jgi:hypothetical protein